MAEADTIYRVLTVYGADANQARSEFSYLASTLDHVMNLAERAKEMIGGILELSSAAEGSRIAIAGLMNASGFPGAGNFNTSLKMSSEILKQMRHDAAALPGTFEDLQQIFQRAIPGGARAGKSVLEIEQLSGQLMAVSKAFSLPIAVAGHEFAEMMEGRARTNNALFAKLKQFMGPNMSAPAFNAMSSPKQWEAISKALEKFDPMVKEYSKTWDTIHTTTESYIAQLVRIGSGSMFEGMKSALQSVNEWYERNQASVDEFADLVGSKLGAAFSAVAGIIESVIPPAYEFFLGLWDVLKNVVGTIYEVASAVSDLLAPAFGAAGDNARLLGEIVGAMITGFVAYRTVVFGVEMVTKGWAAAQALVNAVMAASPIVWVVGVVAALAAGVALVLSYLDELVDSFTDLTDSDLTRGLLKKAGVLPQNASDEDINESAFGKGGRARAKADRDKRMTDTFGDAGVAAHVKSMLNGAGLGRFGDNDAVSKGYFGPNLPGPQDRIKALVAQAGKPVEIHNTSIVMHTTIYESEDAARVVSLLTKKLSDSIHKPSRSAQAGVI